MRTHNCFCFGFCLRIESDEKKLKNIFVIGNGLAQSRNSFAALTEKRLEMAKIEIRYKCITMAREVARKNSTARITGRSVFIKRCYKSYRLIGVIVTEKQRNCRDIFAEAQRMAKEDLRNWNRRRHWARLARRHKIGGAHRMAVSCYYRLLKENGGQVNDILGKERIAPKERWMECKVVLLEEWRRWREDREVVCLAG